MKRCFLVAFLALNVIGLRAQPDDQNQGWTQAQTEENFKMLKGHVDDLIDRAADQDKHFDALERKITELRAQVTKLSANTYATPDDVKRLADAIQEVDRKRQADFETLRRMMQDNFVEVKKLIQTMEASTPAPAPPPPHHPKPTAPPAESQPEQKETGFYYTVAKGDQLGTIVQACREKGLKVTRKQIEAANPDIDPQKLKVNQKLFIPTGEPDKQQ